jgi:hypothetical protein
MSFIAYSKGRNCLERVGYSYQEQARIEWIAKTRKKESKMKISRDTYVRGQAPVHYLVRSIPTVSLCRAQKGSKKSVDTPAQHTPSNPGGSIPAPPSHGEYPAAEFLPSPIVFIA